MRLQTPPLCSAQEIFAVNTVPAIMLTGLHASLHDIWLAILLACLQA
jgi:hypothetical protein